MQIERGRQADRLQMRTDGRIVTDESIAAAVAEAGTGAAWAGRAAAPDDC